MFRSGFDATDVIPQQKRFKSDVTEFIDHVKQLKHNKLPKNVHLAVAGLFKNTKIDDFNFSTFFASSSS